MLDRTLAPPYVKPSSFRLPTTETDHLRNGVSLNFFADIPHEITSLEVVFKAGKWHEPKPGVSYFTAHMLDKGTTSHTSTQIAAFFDQYGAHMEVESGFDFVSISLYTLSRHVSTLLPLFFEILSKPSFPDSELELMKDTFIQSLNIKNEKTDYLASKLVRKEIFGAGHPYGETIEVHDVKKLAREDLTSFFTTHMTVSHVFILGALDAHDRDIIKTEFSSMPLGVFSEKSHVFQQRIPSSRRFEKKGSVQSSIRLGKRTLNRKHKDYFNLLILNYYLGGYFGSRLMKNLREEKGLTYGISSYLRTFKNDAILLIHAEVDSGKRELAVDEIRKELVLLAKKGIEKKVELEDTIRHFLGSLQAGVASPFSVMGKAKTIVLYDLSPTFYQDLIHHVEATSLSSLLKSAQTYLKEDSFFETSVG